MVPPRPPPLDDTVASGNGPQIPQEPPAEVSSQPDEHPSDVHLTGTATCTCAPIRPPRNDLRDQGKQLRRSQKEHRLENVLPNGFKAAQKRRRSSSPSPRETSPTTPPAGVAAHAHYVLINAAELARLTAANGADGQTNRGPVIPDPSLLRGAFAPPLDTTQRPMFRMAPEASHGMAHCTEEARLTLEKHDVEVAAYINTGGFGSIYRATRHGEPVALKVIRKHHAYQYPDGRDKVLRELHVLRTAAEMRLPYVLPLYESFSDSHCIYIVTVCDPCSNESRKTDAMIF